MNKSSQKSKENARGTPLTQELFQKPINTVSYSMHQFWQATCEWLATLRNFYLYLLKSQNFWLIPIFTALMLSAVLLVVSEGTIAAPVVYTLF